MNWVYILRCGDGSLYTGWTNDLDARVALHASGRGCKYTRYSEEYVSEHDARSREWHIKRLSRKEKLSLIERKETPPDVQKI